MEPRGTFTVHVIEGKGLAAKDMGGKSDPYAVLTCAGVEKRTETMMKTLAPKWNERFEFDIYNPDLAMVSLELYDWDRYSRDDFMGLVELPIKKYEDEEEKDVWVKLERSEVYPKEKVKGEVHLKVKYTVSAFGDEETMDKYDHVIRKVFDEWGIVGLQGVLSETRPNNETARALVRLLLWKGKFEELFVLLVEHEVEATAQETALFRTDSWTTKMMQAFSRLTGLDYLKSAVKDAILNLMSKSATTELDPTRLGGAGSIKANQETMLAAAEVFLRNILESTPRIPGTMASLLAAFRSVIEKKYPESGLKQVGGFFFLRFVCPAIWQPDAFGLTDTAPTPGQRRALVLMAKILMNLSNGVEFGEKEDYMVPMNEFIRAHLGDIEGFFQLISSADSIEQCMGDECEMKPKGRDLVAIAHYWKLQK